MSVITARAYTRHYAGSCPSTGTRSLTTPSSGPDDQGHGRVAPGAQSWTADGKIRLPLLDGPTEAERAAGVVFTSITGSMFVVGHPDYVRSVRIVPDGPERIRLVVDWLLPRGYGDPDPEILEHMVSFARQVIVEDGEACELNQSGLHSNRFQHGVLVPQEYVLWDFHQWLRRKLDDAG